MNPVVDELSWARSSDMSASRFVRAYKMTSAIIRIEQLEKTANIVLPHYLLEDIFMDSSPGF